MAIQNVDFFANIIDGSSGEELQVLGMKTLFDMCAIYGYDEVVSEVSDRRLL